MNNKIENNAKRVIEKEATALSILSQNIPDDFNAVVKLIVKLKGHLLISGVGKSGHIGRKIAASLSSTGTPSYFVHATEASHGDLGALTQGDACLLISNSGESTELLNLVEYTRRFSIPLIAISSSLHSSLMEASDHKLLLPSVPEACPMGLAPTTSTMMVLALGDALTVALMQERRFSSDNFRILHPGGKLGTKVIKVHHLMHHGEAIPIVDPSETMANILIEMTSKGFGVTIVGKRNKVVGVITDGDLRRHMDNLMDMKASDLASTKPVTVRTEALALEALALMNQKKINVIIVVDKKDNIAGILHLHDCIRAGLL